MIAHDDQFPESSINLHTLNDDDESTVMEVNPTPLPKLQLLAVFAPKLAGNITTSFVRPFINQFIRETGITNGDERKTGYYAGIIESTFAFSEGMSVVPWGYISDRLGRRPALLLGPFGLTFGLLAFGSLDQFWPLVVARFFHGVCTGGIEIWKAAVAELTDATNIGDAFALSPLIYSFGSAAGPFIGGVLSNPAVRFPNSLGRMAFLRRHPYFLPCAVVGLLSFAAWVAAYILLKETLPVILAREKLKSRRNDLGIEESCIDRVVPEEIGLLTQDEQINHGASHRQYDEPPKFPLRGSPSDNPRVIALMTKPLIFTYLNRTCLGFLTTCDHVLLPLMYSTSIPLGGLGLDPFRIGLALGSFGVINSIVQFTYFGRMMRKLGPRKLYILSFMAFLNCFAIYPLMSYFSQRAGRVDGMVFVLMLVQLASGIGNYTAHGALQVLLVENVPPGGGIATANGIAEMVSSAVRTTAPTFVSSLFSLSLTKQLLGGHLVYYVLLAMTLVGMRLSYYLQDGRNRNYPRR